MITEAVILAGGLGTRLLPMTETQPKPLVAFQGSTIIEVILHLLRRQGIVKATLCVGYLGKMIENHLGDGHRFGMEFTYSYDKELLGTGGALAKSSRPCGTFLLVNADVLYDFDLFKAYESHKKSEALATVLLTKVPDPSRYAAVALDGDLVTSFVMRPKSGEASTNLVSSGYCILEPEIFDHFPEGKFSLEYDIYPKLAIKRKINSYLSSGAWFDLGTHESLTKASVLWRGQDAS